MSPPTPGPPSWTALSPAGSGVTSYPRAAELDGSQPGWKRCHLLPPGRRVGRLSARLEAVSPPTPGPPSWTALSSAGSGVTSYPRAAELDGSQPGWKRCHLLPPGRRFGRLSARLEAVSPPTPGPPSWTALSPAGSGVTSYPRAADLDGSQSGWKRCHLLPPGRRVGRLSARLEAVSPPTPGPPSWTALSSAGSGVTSYPRAAELDGSQLGWKRCHLLPPGRRVGRLSARLEAVSPPTPGPPSWTALSPAGSGVTSYPRAAELDGSQLG